MKIKIRGLRLGLDSNESDIKIEAAKQLQIRPEFIQTLKISKKAVDARRKKVCFSYSVEVEVENTVIISEDIFNDINISLVKNEPEKQLKKGSARMRLSPLVVGSGPAGLFCALVLARNGYAPVIIEQGLDIDQRIEKTKKFWNGGTLDPWNNAQFGEGGSGGFSDGKLIMHSDDDCIQYVLKALEEFGASKDINWLNKPHVGTDVICQVIKKIRKEIIRLGGEIWFSTQLTDIKIRQGVLHSVEINGETEVEVSTMVLAVGHSARNIYRLLHQKGVVMTPKAFAVGVRLEHPQEVIDYMEYGEFAEHPALGPAAYNFSYQDRATGRSVYTFCTCPGGHVIAASSEKGQLVADGMSYAKRDSGVANSAVVVTVSPDDWDDEVLGGVDYQEELEEKAFQAGGGNYYAPAQYLQDFMEKDTSLSLKGSIATYRPGLTPANMWKLFPREISEVLFRGLQSWGKKAPEFMDEQAIMTGIETRTSAPLRIVRDEERVSVNVRHMYPCGEGAGYAGGIISAAVDGIKTAQQIIATYSEPEQCLEIHNQKSVQGSKIK